MKEIPQTPEEAAAAAKDAAEFIAKAKERTAAEMEQLKIAPAGGSKEGVGVIKRATMHMVDPRMVTRKEGFNPRFDFGVIEELAKSIKANGVLQPLRVKRLDRLTDGKMFELIDGDRRLTAIELLISKGEAFADGVPALIVDKGQEDTESLIQALETNSGKPLTPIEEAMAYKRLKDSGMTARAIATRLGRDYVHVTTGLALLEADPELQEAVKAGDVGVIMAKHIAVHARGDKEKQAELLKKAKEAKNDPVAKRAVKQAIDDTRRAKAAKQGKKLKMRALTDAELGDLGMKVAQHVAKCLKDTGKPLDFNIRKWIKEDDKLALAAAFGALEALKAAAGTKISLTF